MWFERLGCPRMGGNGQLSSSSRSQKWTESCRVEEEGREEKGKPGTVNTPTDALRNVSCRAAQGRERQERRGEEGGEQQRGRDGMGDGRREKRE